MGRVVRAVLALLLLWSGAGCASGTGTLESPTGVATDSAGSGYVPDIDPGGVYRAAGMLVQGSRPSFVGDVSFLGAGSADSTIVLVTIALANRSLHFRPDSTLRRAGYTVSIGFSREGSDSAALRVESHETVRLASPRETSASTPDIIFQRFVRLPPAAYTMSVGVRDDRAPEAESLSVAVVVPRLGASSLSSIVPVFDVTPRESGDSIPALIANPDATVVFGRDSLARVYLEGYALPAAAQLSIVLLDDDEQPVLRDSVVLDERRPVAGVVRQLPVARIGPGRFTIVASLAGSVDSVRTPLFVSFGDGIGIASFDELIDRLRYFATPEQLRALGAAPPAKRAAAWEEFLKETDPDPGTTEHERLRDYFERIANANQHFSGEGVEGWRTDRGKVYVALGEPDRVLMDDDRGTGTQATTQLWEYDDYELRLVFESDVGFDQWRLTSRSELDFERALQRARLH